jgi:sugar phosphate isomerase/epimerase
MVRLLFLARSGGQRKHLPVERHKVWQRNKKMKFGCCADRSKAKVLRAAGYEYIELGVSSDLNPFNETDSIQAVLSDAGLPVDAFNVMVHSSLKITGPDRNLDALKRYMSLACERAEALGGKLLVFGSGGARQVPDGYDYSAATEEIIEFLQAIADTVKKHHLEIALEPLHRAECNIVTSVKEATAIVTQVGRPDVVNVLSDLYHVTQEGQSFQETTDAGPKLRHVHIASGTDRHPPTWADTEELTQYFSALKSAGYDSRISIEATWKDFEREIEEALAVMRQIWAGVLDSANSAERRL